ncbi:MAG: metalloregulator ArsR/SmtB family transcription factor [bacterium]|nr:metalloregulator ArsR/SmtB family transcription factor [bacterium]
MKNLEKILKGLANKRRLAIIKLLLQKKRPLSVGEIADAIRLSFTATSKHLNLLRQLDIVERNQVSLTVFYRLADSLPAAVRVLIFLISNSRE